MPSQQLGCPGSSAAAVAAVLCTAATLHAQSAAAAAASGPVDASTYVPGPVDVGWQVWVGAIVGVIPFIIGAYEFGKRILIQRRCALLAAVWHVISPACHKTLQMRGLNFKSRTTHMLHQQSQLCTTLLHCCCVAVTGGVVSRTTMLLLQTDPSAGAERVAAPAS